MTSESNENMTTKEVYINTPVPPETAEKLQRIAQANGRRKSREASRMIIRAVERAKEPTT